MEIDKEFIYKELKGKVDVQYYHKIFSEGKEIKAEWMLEPQKPENLVEDTFRKILKNIGIPADKFLSQNRVKIFDVFKNKHRWPDFKFIKHRKSEKDLLIELEPYNSDIQVGIDQTEEWIRDIRIGTYSDALVINLNQFVLIFFDGSEVHSKELSIKDACNHIKNVVFGKEVTIKYKDINRITEQFYNQFFALIHGGPYTNTKKEKITISTQDAIINNLHYTERLVDIEKIEFVNSIFNRLIFIKILIDWNLFPDIFPYLREVPHHLIHTDLNNLFFKTLAVKEQERVNLPKEYDKIPFLNGGLFRKTDIEKKNPDLVIDARFLTKVFDFLEEYSFLENGDDNNSINSEILGYIFEKTIEFRKGTGSYYTHNLICDYMCESVLIPHYLIRINDYLKSIGYKDEELLENLEEIYMLKEKTLKKIYDKIIKNVKVCDICVGSGAFLLAMGNLILEIHERIITILRIKSSKTELKQYIVEYNLFGVDMMVSAIQICQLRLWLWISENSSELSPLPNIEYNLRVGNSLLGTDTKINIRTMNYKFINKINSVKFLDKKDPNLVAVYEELSKGAISFESLKLLKTTLINLFLYSHDQNTVLLKDLIDSLNELIIEDANRIYLNYLKNKIKNKKFTKGLTVEFLKRLKAFHWYLEFPQVFPKGFDVIVGNPPYISAKFMEKIELEQDLQMLNKELKKRTKRLATLKSNNSINEYKERIKTIKKEIKLKNELLKSDYYVKEKLFNSIYKEFLKKDYVWTYKIYDILVPFFEKGFKLLRKNQKTYLSFITSNKFLATDYGQVIRKDFLNDFQIEMLVDISMIKVFKDAAVYPIIITLKNSKAPKEWLINIGRYRNIDNLGKNLKRIEQSRYNKKETNYLIYIPLHKDSFELFDKINKHEICSPIGEEFISSYREFNFTNWGDYEIFVKSNKGEVLGVDYFLYVTNNDLKPYQIVVTDQLYFHKEIPVGENPKKLKFAQDKWEVFSKKLLMIKEVALDLICALGKNYANIGKIYALRLKEGSEYDGISNYYFLALFNSKLLDFYFRIVFWNTHLSGGYLNYHFSYLSILPILKIDRKSMTYKRIVILSKCLEILSNDLTKLLLDLLVVNAYFPNDLKISAEQVSFIDEYIGKKVDYEVAEEINLSIKKIKRNVLKLCEHEYFQIMVNERQFKGDDDQTKK